MDKITNTVALAGLRATNNPLLTIAEFVFTDDQPNDNKWAISVEEFPNLQATAIGMPVKMRYTGVGAEDHSGAVPLGYIRDLKHVEENGVNKLVAEAALWSDEYPEEIEYLKKAYAEGKAPGISYEVAYNSVKSIVDKGVTWFKDTVALAATFVRRPSYGSRTHLIALASLEEKDRNKEIVALAESITAASAPNDEPKDKGGNQMDPEKEKELEKLRAEASSKDSQISDLMKQLEDKDASYGKLEEENKGLKLAAVVSKRESDYTAAGFKLDKDQEKADKRRAFWGTLDDDGWSTYLDDLKAVAPKPASGQDLALASRAQASAQNALPRVEVEDVDLSNLKGAMRGLARPHLSE